MERLSCSVFNRPGDVAGRRLPAAAHFLARYGLAVVFVAAALSIRFALSSLIGDASPFMVLAPAALLAAHFGGLGPGLLATGAGIALGDYYFTPPLYSWGPYGPAEITLIITYTIATLVGVILFHRLQKSKIVQESAARRAELAAHEANIRGQALEREISQRLMAEQDLRQAKDKLAEHAGQLEYRVQARTAHLHQALSSFQSVLYHIAHDLRGPLRIMQAFSEMLVSNYGGRLDSTGQDYARRVSNAASRLDQLLHSLLEYGHVCQLEIIPSTIHLDHALKTVISQFSGRMEISHARVDIASPLPEVYGDSRLLHVVLTQIISNALKFVPPGRDPRIRIWAEALSSPNSSSVRVHVQDNGIGIDPAHQERVFGIFQRLHQDNSNQSTGMGLAIAQKAIERMDGFIGVTSTPQQGSTFWVELPVPPSDFTLERKAGALFPEPDQHAPARFTWPKAQL